MQQGATIYSSYYKQEIEMTPLRLTAGHGKISYLEGWKTLQMAELPTTGQCSSR